MEANRSLSNVNEAYAQSSPANYRQEFAWTSEEAERSRRWGGLAGEMTTNMHEVIGHASGQLAERLGGSAQPDLKEQYSALEEARADLVGLYFLPDPKLVELGVLPADAQEEIVRAEYESYTRNALLQLRRIREGTQIEEDHNADRQDSATVDPKALKLLVRNLGGLTRADTERLAYEAVCNGGAITACDLPNVMQAKYELLNRNGVLSFEYDTARFSDLGGLKRFKAWLDQRRKALNGSAGRLEPPKGVMLIGVQGCGKSLAAKAAAGILNVPLLRLDFGALYNKFHGETERNLRESLKQAEVMNPCVLWIDELEKGLATGSGDSGLSRRILGTFLTWMAEKDQSVFVVATANDITQLPPELVRKGRFDEIFFVDLPSPRVRADILRIHLKMRDLDVKSFDLAEMTQASTGFSGAEIEQAIVSALYTASAAEESLATAHVLAECQRTRPLSVVMREKIQGLRAWAAERTVPAD